MPDTIVREPRVEGADPVPGRGSSGSSSATRAGNGLQRDARPTPEGYADRLLIDDAWAVLDAVGAEQAVLVGLCTGAGYVVLMAAEAPGARARHLRDQPGAAAEPAAAAQGRVRLRRAARVVRRLAEDEPPLLAARTGRTSRSSSSRRCSPSRTRPSSVEDCVGWAMQTTPEAMILAGLLAAVPRRRGRDASRLRRRCGARCSSSPGRSDQCQNPVRGTRLAEITGGDHVVIEGGGHLPAGEGSGEGEPAAAGLRAARGIGREAPRLPGRSPAVQPPAPVSAVDVAWRSPPMRRDRPPCPAHPPTIRSS